MGPRWLDRSRQRCQQPQVGYDEFQYRPAAERRFHRLQRSRSSGPLNGLAPGVEAFVIDPSSDGLAQIAAILAANDLTNLSSISIVGHGAAGLQVGSTTLDAGDLRATAPRLRRSGRRSRREAIPALCCDTGSGTAGQQFIAELSQLAGRHLSQPPTEDIGTLQGTNFSRTGRSTFDRSGDADARSRPRR